MIRCRSTILVAVFLASVLVASGQPIAPEWAERLVRNVQSSSFPELAKKDIRIDQFTSDSDYFQARFSIPRFMLGRRMRYVIRHCCPKQDSVVMSAVETEGLWD